MQRYDEDEVEQIFLDEENKSSELTLQSRDKETKASESPGAYKRLRHLLIGVVLVTAMLALVRGISLNRFMSDFMAIFFITFAALKFIDIERFAHSYRSYDIIAKHVRPWAYILPFTEAFMGFWYLLSEAPKKLNVLALIITGTALIGAIIGHKQNYRFKYPATKSFITLPLVKISLIENSTMFIFALTLIILKI